MSSLQEMGSVSIPAAALQRWIHDHATLGILTTDTQLRVLSWNRWLEANSGRRATDVVGRNLLDVFPDLVERNIVRYFEQALQGQVVVLAQRFHKYLLPFPGLCSTLRRSYMPQSALIAPLWEGERIVGIIVSIEDVSERVEHEADLRRQVSELEALNRALAESEARYRVLAEQTLAGVFIIQDGRFRYVNQALADMTGCTRDELMTVGDPLVFIAPENRAEAAERVERLIGGEIPPEPYCHIGLRKDGSRRELQMLGSPVILDGRPALVGVVLDVTEQRRAERALRESEERFRAVLKGSPVIVFNHDRELRYTWVYNPAWREPEEIVGKTDAELADPAEAAALMAIKRSVLESGVGRRAEVPLHDLQGVLRHFDLTVEPLRDTDGQVVGLTCVAVDITARKQMEDELHRLNRALRVVSESNQVLVRAKDEAELLREICRIAVEQGGYRLAWVGRAEYDVDCSVLPVASAGDDAGYLESVRISWNPQYAERFTPIGQAVHTGEVMVVDNILEDARCASFREHAVQRGYLSYVALPLKVEDKIWGTLNIYAAQTNAFTEQEMTLFRELAADLAHGLEVFRLRARQREAMEQLRAQARQREMLAQLSVHALTAHDLQELLDDVVVGVAEVLGSEVAHVLELQPEEDVLLLRAAVGWEEELIGRATLATTPDTPCGYTLCARNPVVVERLAEDTRLRDCGVLLAHGAVSGISVPIPGTERPFGVLGAYTRTPRTFTPDEVTFMESVATLLAHAFEHARDAERVHARQRELSTLNRIVTAAASGLPARTVMETACRELAQVLDLPHVLVWLVEARHNRLTLAAEYCAPGQAPALTRDIPLTDEAVRTHLLLPPEALPTTAQETPRLFAPGIRLLVDEDAGGTRLVLPLVAEGELLGSVELLAGRARHFNPAEIDLARAVVAQTAVVLARARLLEDQRRLVAAVEQADDCVAVFDPEGYVRYLNAACARTIGWSVEEALGQRVPMPGPENPLSELCTAAWAVFNSGQAWQGQLTMQHLEGETLTLQASITPVTDEQGQVVSYVAVARDVTREVELEEQLRQAQKMEAIGQLTAGIAHDFNNLLTGINGFAELLQMELPPDHPSQTKVARILSSGGRAAELVRQLLAFSRKQVIRPVTLDLNEAVLRMEAMLRRFIGEHIELRIQLSPEAWPVKMDPTQLEQVIINLAVNARDAMPDGGVLTITTTNVTLTEKDVAHYLEVAPGEYVRLSVSDTGCGMPREVMERIFEPFFTTKGVGKGTGLGLSVVHGIVKQNRGHIEVHSEVGKGSTFHIYLPRDREAVSAAEPAKAEATPPEGSETVLLVEDEPAVRELAQLTLESLGYWVLTAASGEEALRVAARHDGPIHLLLTDVVMPGMSGKTLADRLRLLRPGLRAIFMSGYPEEILSYHRVLGQDTLLLHKPFTRDELARVLRQALGMPEEQPDGSGVG